MQNFSNYITEQKNTLFGFVYKTTNKINGKSYIGMCSSKCRFDSYLGSGKLLKQAIEKYGPENFEREVLEECDNDKDLRLAETKWIQYFNAVESQDFYNLCEGGRGGDTGFNISMSSVVKNVWDNYSETEKKNRLKDFGKYDKSGKKNPMYGKSAVTEKNLKWYTDGTINLYITENTQPDGYRRGRTIKRKEVVADYGTV